MPSMHLPCTQEARGAPLLYDTSFSAYPFCRLATAVALAALEGHRWHMAVQAQPPA